MASEIGIVILLCCAFPVEIWIEIQPFMSSTEFSENICDRDAGDLNTRLAAASRVARGMTLTGNITSQGDIVIDGTMRGEIRGLNVLIGKDASVDGPITADRVTIEGYVCGQVVADHIHLASSARVNGDLSSKNLTIIKGAVFLGRINPERSTLTRLAASQVQSAVPLSLAPPPAMPLVMPPVNVATERAQLAEPGVRTGQIRSNLQRRLADLAYIR
jgi:cytoskeletal protein CcmA (bactofilin family)